ncbi:MAG: LysE family transporter [Rikenellaceae bacterium]
MTLDFIEAFARSILVGIAASITVGPVAVLCIQRTLSKSRRSGLFSGLGVACADTLMAVVAYFFYALLQHQIESYILLLRVVGGLFVVVVGVYIYFQNPVLQIKKNRRGEGSDWQDFVSVFGLTLANFIMVIPYILAFFAVFKVAGDGDPLVDGGALLRGLLVSAGFFAGSVGWWSLLAWVINLFRSGFRPRHLLTINHVAGILIGGLGAYTIISTFLQFY